MVENSSGMAALVRTERGVELLRMERPAPLPANHVRVRIERAGLCRTDLNVASGRLRCEWPRVLGHEVAGIVSELGARAARVRLGQRVTVNPLLPCLRCAECARGEVCEAPRMLGVDQDGGFSEELVLPESAVFPVPDSMSFERAAYVEPVAAAMAVLDCPLDREGAGLIVGSGRIAELTRRVLLAQGFPSPHVVASEGAGPQRGFAWAIDTVGTTESLALASRALRQRGLLVLKSRPAELAGLDIRFAVERELVLRAVRYAPFEHAIELLASPRFEVEDLFGGTYPLAEFERVFAEAARSEGSKLFFALDAGSR
ncbi:MAG TPA: alcohol dehydrogenase catalytic domain-containing protein [Polyangiaceae bacterium]|nr:alcohol dehydrogenase catalytic domain-containing protein [Polyangiaceae bacterium]